ncbi:MAG: bifunctional folylpolyglutamate synthase/dihydrofolate synthase [Lachnospiraceae bacterium]|nr:bifunctional folylpolyglutamate synthase/dihydrofolate synthase [Lachnospiraceae bacterium]
MKYEEVIEIIENKRRFGNAPGVEISRVLLSAVSNPQKDLKFVHIAGTNGKGSTAAFLASILKEAGIKTGLFTSPHLISFTERIRVDGEQIPKERAAEIGEMLLNLELDVHPTMFDYCLAMAMLYFKEQNCEIVVLETGLGGRLDSTNCIEPPLISIITKIGYDHTNVLGNTLPEIATEKAGICKAGTQAVIEKQDKEVLDVLTAVCKNLDIPVHIADAAEMTMKNYFSNMKMRGNFQKENASAAILAAKILQTMEYPITEASLQKGISHALWQGRMELICEEPFLLIDGAHNSHGVHALAESLKTMYPGEKFHFIMGVLADKDYEQMAELILPLAKDVVTVTPESSRALQSEKLAEYICKKGIPAKSGKDLKSVFTPYLKKEKIYPKNEKTITFGSLYFIGDVRKFFHLSV